VSILSVRSVTKQFKDNRALDEVSFEIPKGSIFGLLGPNGAGKTTLIRIITCILQADEGKIFFDGDLLEIDHPSMMGYLPEERGLYRKMKVGDHLLYLAQLKGLSGKMARNQIGLWMDKFQIADWWEKKIDELSKGMQQKIQFIATIVHNPKLIILDEPFSGLDPINTNLIKKEIRALNQAGTSVVFSTHRMEQVEEMCEFIVLIDDGKNMLEGKVSKIKDSYKENHFKFSFKGEIPTGVLNKEILIEQKNGEVTLQLKDLYEANKIMHLLIERNIIVTGFQEILPTLNEIFIKQVTKDNGQTVVNH
jgi:ABC-2 type transport system ATP-binding protein